MEGRKREGNKKKAEEEHKTLIFVDEVGFSLLPSVSKTTARRGHPPILKAPYEHKRLNMMGGLTLDGRLITRMREDTYKGTGVVEFLRHLLEKVAGKIVVVWDNAPIHRSAEVKAFLREEAQGRLHLECLPSYAPELNPIEATWKMIKRVELKNVCCLDLQMLKEKINAACQRVRGRKDALLGCITQTHAYY